MAEGWGNNLKSDFYEFYSAGTIAQGLNSRAVAVMKEEGIDLETHRSKTVDDLKDINFDYVITVCSDAHETCPYFPGGKILHYGFDDPPRLTFGMKNEDEILGVYRRVRDEIKTMVQNIETYLEK